MTVVKPVQKSANSVMLWIMVGLLIAAGVWANYHFSDIDFTLRLIAWVVLILIASGMAWLTVQGKAVWLFAKEARMELRKVVWPTRQETLQVTMMVIAVVAILGLIIWGIDTLFLHVIGWLAGQRG